MLGVELADALRARNCDVTVLLRSDRLMGKQLDAIAGAHLAEELAFRGIRILFHSALVELAGTAHLSGVRIASRPPLGESQEQSLPAELFIFATGTVPNKELAGAARLSCDKGILVNEHLQTSDPHIFAIGECAQFGDVLAGTTAAAGAQAEALAEYLRGHDHAFYKPVPAANILKVRGLHLATAGITDPLPPDFSAPMFPLSAAPSPTESPCEVITFHDSARRRYQKCVIQNDRLVGAICLGDSTRFAEFHQWITSGLELESQRDTLLNARAAAAISEGPIICSCHNVGRDTIHRAAVDAPDLLALCRLTTAGTGCGSCRPELAALLAAAKAERSPAKQLPQLVETEG